MEPVYVTARPRYYRQPQDLTMEERLYGLQLPCPGSHIFCTPCLRTYLLERLSQALRGDSIVVARCPACPGDSWRMRESCAARILLPEYMDDWRQQQYLDAVEKVAPESSKLLRRASNRFMHRYIAQIRGVLRHCNSKTAAVQPRAPPVPCAEPQYVYRADPLHIKVRIKSLRALISLPPELPIGRDVLFKMAVIGKVNGWFRRSSPETR